MTVLADDTDAELILRERYRNREGAPVFVQQEHRATAGAVLVAYSGRTRVFSVRQPMIQLMVAVDEFLREGDK